MALGGSERAGQAQKPYDNDDDGIGVAEIKVPATHFLKQKEHADRDKNNRASETAQSAALAVTTNVIAHRS
jgi:hypothetical protein